MKILIIHNRYAKFSGEEAVVEFQKNLLLSKGHHVTIFERSSEEIHGFHGQVHAFFAGIHSTRSIREIRQLLTPPSSFDIIHIHNLYPLISPSILPIISAKGIPVVMTVHNYRLICPNGLFFTKGEICERCTGGRELNCIIRNCERSFIKSTGYALRTWVARIRGSYLRHVSNYICLTEFQKSKLVENGFPGERITVIPNAVNPGQIIDFHTEAGKYVAFAGRISREKGANIINEAAGMLPAIPFRLAGQPDETYLSQMVLSANVMLAGRLDKESMREFYQNAGFLVFPSIWYEGFPMVLLEAMQHHLPVIAPAMAGFPEIIEDGVNGLLFKPGDAADLAEKIRMLWEHEELYRRLGENGYRKLQEKYSPEVYYQKLMEVYTSQLS